MRVTHAGIAALAVTMVAGVAAVPALTAGAAGAATPRGTLVAVSPSPGDRFATPQTTISFRGVTRAALGAVRVTGSRSGVRAGHLVADPAGAVIWRPEAPFAPGERVTVHTGVPIAGARGDGFSFSVARVASHAPQVLPPASGTGPHAIASVSAASPSRAAATCKMRLPRFRSAPDLSPPGDCVNHAATRTARGDLFVTPKGSGKRGDGAAIVNNRGNLIWYDPVNAPFVHNLERVTYRGRHMLAFYQGNLENGFGDGEFVLMNEHYQVVSYIRAGDGDEADLHELYITPHNTALLGAYVPVKMNLTAEGGTAHQVVYNYVVQEIDVATGNVLFSWDSLDHVPVTDSDFPVPAKNAPFDYFHGNSIALTTNGNLLVSGRNVSAVYDINHTTGAVIWRLGGKHSTFHLPAGQRWFCYQHYARQPKANVVTLFDDGGAGPPTCPNHASRGLTLALKPASHTARIVRNLHHKPQLDTAFLGSNQDLPNGDALVSWGNLAEITEFNAANKPNFDMSFSGYTYRVFRAPWTGIPSYPPSVASRKGPGNAVRVYASWNGDTQVASWHVVAGASPSSLHPVGKSKRKIGFQTRITVHTGARWVAAQARNRSGKVLATSQAVRTRFTPTGRGYVVGTKAGNVYNHGAPFHGSLAASHHKPAAPIVGTVVPPSRHGYYLPSAAGNVYNFGAPFFGSPASSGHKPPSPVTGMGAYRNTGYYLATSGGNVYNFGKAPFHGSPLSSGIKLTAPVAGIAVDPKGGYWLAERDGGVLNFGAPWFGSARGKSPPAPIVGIAAEPNGRGYLLVTATGNVYPFGDAPWHGSPAASVINLSSPVVGIATQQATKARPEPSGYYVACANGDVYNFGLFLPGSPDGVPLPSPIAGVGAR